ncbi:unnamed protein product [Brugia timori]|uniref:Secreted protein n=1 Tax=Brugia timori TaxID=42155 RepID=A0A0R3QS97_9BILA|nr:unnamed protein product [Brugia timori]
MFLLLSAVAVQLLLSDDNCPCQGQSSRKKSNSVSHYELIDGSTCTSMYYPLLMGTTILLYFDYDKTSIELRLDLKWMISRSAKKSASFIPP